MGRIWLPVILLLAFMLRVFWLDKYPVGFTPDEASFGYDAYSILKTGRDQWGKTLPLVLESFGDFKSPLYAYLTIPSVAIFGLNKFAVRLPNALLGTLGVLIVYLLTKEIFKEKKYAIFASILLAISPWHVMMSRGAFEANLATFFLPLGILLFFKKHYLLSSIVFGLNLFTYHSAKFVTPLIFLSLLILFRKESKGYMRTPVIIFSLFFVLTIYTFWIGAGRRVSDVSILKNSLYVAAAERIRAVNSGMPDVLARAIHNKYQVAARQFLKNYMSYFSPQFFFGDGPAESTYGMIPGRGVLYWGESIFLFGFLWFVIKEKLSKYLIVIILWLFLAPIPASLATGPGYAANRAVVMLPALQIILATGAVKIFQLVKHKIYFVLYIFITLLLFTSFLEDYFIQSPKKSAQSMLYGNLEVTNWLSELKNDRQIIVSRRLSEPHIYIAFANKWDPVEYQENTGNWSYRERGLKWVDQMPEYSLGKYVFKNFDWAVDGRPKNAVLVGRPNEFPSSSVPSVRIILPDGLDAYWVVTL